MTTTDLLHAYKNGDFDVSIFRNGTKIREGSGKAAFPESMDVKITNWCDAGCQWCHEGSTQAGKHGDLTETVRLIKELPAGVEIAIGGGHPLAHPQFDDFVSELSSSGIICNVTINEKHFESCRERIETFIGKGHVIGVGYSYDKTPCSWKYDNMVSHVIVGVTHPEELDAIIATNKKVLLLGYKQFGRGVIYDRKHKENVRSKIDAWYRYLFSAAKKAHLSFDNLAITQLNPARLLSRENYDRFYMGEDGKHSMYIDAVKQQYGVSSTSVERMPLGRSIEQMFASI